jgi:hypothetical protein
MSEQLESLPDIVSKNKLEDDLDELRVNELPVSSLISEESGAE